MTVLWCRSWQTISLDLRVILFLICLSLAATSLAGESSSVEDVFAHAMLLPQRCHSYQYVVVSKETSAGKPKEERIIRARFWQSGSSLRSEVEFNGRRKSSADALSTESANDLGPVISAFNGVKYQVFLKKQSTLTFSSQCRAGNPYFIPNPLLIPYLWLVADSKSMNWTDIKDPQCWEAKCGEAKYEGRRHIASRKCEVISLPYVSAVSGFLATVYFDPERAYLPLSYDVRSNTGKLVLTVEVTETKEFIVDGESLYLPVHIVSRESGEVPVVREISINASSLLVNRPIDGDLFTLSPAMARVVDDYDVNIKNQPPIGDRYYELSRVDTGGKSAGGWRYYFLYGNLTIILLIVMLICWKRFKKSAVRVCS